MVRIIGSLLLWTCCAVIAAAIVVVLYLAWDLSNKGLSINGLSPDQLITEVIRYQHLLFYAAIVGFALGLISLVPAVVRENAERILFWAVFGAISGAITALCIMFLYKGYGLMMQGVDADSISFVELIAGKMQLHLYVPYGAAIGALVAVVLVLFGLRQTRPTAFADSANRLQDPDEMIRTQRAKRARRYLAERGTKDPDLQ